MGTADLAVIVCTRNRAKQLERMLESLRFLKTDRSWELIVVNSASTDTTDEVINQFAASFPRQVVHVVTEKPGLGLARNAGLRATSARIVLFTDDDCYPSPDWLDKTCLCFEEDGELGVVGGRILLHDPRDYPITIQLKAEAERFRARSLVIPGVLQGANLSFRRDALDSVHGFDARLGSGTPFSCEDIDVVARISAAGWAVAYDPRPTVSHHHGRRMPEDVAKLIVSYDHGRGAFYAKMLADRRVRLLYARRWLLTIKHSPLRCTRRELAGAIRFAWTSLFDRI